MTAIGRAFDRVTRLINVICGVLICLMSVHVAADVSARYLFNAPLDGTVEFVQYYYMVAVIFLPLPYLQYRRRHFAAVIFTSMAPPWMLRLMLLFSDFVAAVLAGFATWQSTVTALAKTRSGEHLETAHFIVYQWPGRWLVIAGFGLMCVAACLGIVEGLIGANGRRPDTERLSESAG
jgi:TRAP-type C4-dicarboxylate transport system permease small subunit